MITDFREKTWRTTRNAAIVQAVIELGLSCWA